MIRFHRSYISASAVTFATTDNSLGRSHRPLVGMYILYCLFLSANFVAGVWARVFSFTFLICELTIIIKKCVLIIYFGIYRTPRWIRMMCGVRQNAVRPSALARPRLSVNLTLKSATIKKKKKKKKQTISGHVCDSRSEAKQYHIRHFDCISASTKNDQIVSSNSISNFCCLLDIKWFTIYCLSMDMLPFGKHFSWRYLRSIYIFENGHRWGDVQLDFSFRPVRKCEVSGRFDSFRSIVIFNEMVLIRWCRQLLAIFGQNGKQQRTERSKSPKMKLNKTPKVWNDTNFEIVKSDLNEPAQPSESRLDDVRMVWGFRKRTRAVTPNFIKSASPRPRLFYTILISRLEPIGRYRDENESCVCVFHSFRSLVSLRGNAKWSRLGFV